MLGTVACALRAVAVGREMRLVFPQEAEVVDDGLEVASGLAVDHLARGCIR